MMLAVISSFMICIMNATFLYFGLVYNYHVLSQHSDRNRITLKLGCWYSIGKYIGLCYKISYQVIWHMA